MTDRLPLPKPDGVARLYVNDGFKDVWTTPSMHSHAAAQSAADHAELRTHLGELLAVLHGDGGHYEAEHGTDKAVADAMVKFYDRIKRADAEQFALRERVKALADALKQVLEFQSAPTQPTIHDWGRWRRAALEKTS